MVMLAVKIGTVIALTTAVFFGYFLYQQQAALKAPIVDEPCPSGTQRVGEGCMTDREACEIRGDQYYFDTKTDECLIS